MLSFLGSHKLKQKSRNGSTLHRVFVNFCKYSVAFQNFCKFWSCCLTIKKYLQTTLLIFLILINQIILGNFLNGKIFPAKRHVTLYRKTSAVNLAENINIYVYAHSKVQNLNTSLLYFNFVIYEKAT